MRSTGWTSTGTTTRRGPTCSGGGADPMRRVPRTCGRSSSRTTGRSGDFWKDAWASWPARRQNERMRISAKVDYALRASIELAAVAPEQVKGERLATAQAIPHKFLENILADLRNGGLVASQRGADGGYRLARPATEITVADVIRVVEGPIASVRGERPDELVYEGTAAPLRDTWVELRTAMRGVLEETTLADRVERGRTGGARPVPTS